ncbi:hypothetical protein D3C80_1831500 [compost metagenome]
MGDPQLDLADAKALQFGLQHRHGGLAISQSAMGRECVEVIDKGGVGGAVDAVPEIAGNARRRRD